MYVGEGTIRWSYLVCGRFRTPGPGWSQQLKLRLSNNSGPFGLVDVIKRRIVVIFSNCGAKIKRITNTAQAAGRKNLDI